MSRRANREGSIFKRSDGRWCATVSLDNGRRKSFYGKRREDVARKLAIAHQRRAARGFSTEDLDMFLGFSPWRDKANVLRFFRWVEQYRPARGVGHAHGLVDGTLLAQEVVEETFGIWPTFEPSQKEGERQDG